MPVPGSMYPADTSTPLACGLYALYAQTAQMLWLADPIATCALDQHFAKSGPRAGSSVTWEQLAAPILCPAPDLLNQKVRAGGRTTRALRHSLGDSDSCSRLRTAASDGSAPSEAAASSRPIPASRAPPPTSRTAKSTVTVSLSPHTHFLGPPPGLGSA